MSSYSVGKQEISDWVRKHFKNDATILDVGACDGVWKRFLPEYKNMDALEVFGLNFAQLTDYREKYLADIRDFEYDWYDLIVFGDIIEHLPVKDAQSVLNYAWGRCLDLIIAVPWLYPQGELYGNPYEIHIQDDLTPEIFAQRYPDYELLLDTGYNYCYYHKKGGYYDKARDRDSG